MKFKILVNSTREAPEGLYFVGRMIYEGWGNGIFYRYSQLRKTVNPVDLWAGLPISIEHNGRFFKGQYQNNVFRIGTILKAFANDRQKELLCEGILTEKGGIQSFKNGKVFLSVGIKGWKILQSAFGLMPDHLSLVADPAFEHAQILSKDKKTLEENMDEEALKALAQQIKEIQGKFDSLTPEEQSLLVSLIQELYDATPVDEETMADEGDEKDAKIAELEAKIAELEASKSKSEENLSKAKKTIGILSLNKNKEKVEGTLSSNTNKSFSMKIK